MGLRDIDRLIEMGLSRYGAGDFDGALVLWEEALAIEPDNAQAASYVDYVKLNYEVLSNGAMSIESVEPAPYGIEEEPEYQIQIMPGEQPLPPAAQIITLGPVDDGWDDGVSDGAFDEAAPSPKSDDLDIGTAGPTQGFFRGDELSGGSTQGFFRGDEATSYEQMDEEPESDFEGEGTGSFANERTPEFTNLQTEIKKRNLGFVKPIESSSKAAPAAKTTAPTRDSIALAETAEHETTAGSDVHEADSPDDDDLLSSLPTPRPITYEPDSGEIRLPSRMTRDLPTPARPPAHLDPASLSQADVVLSHAPTRELGLRAAAAALTNPSDDDAPTGQSDVRMIREAARRNDGGAAVAREETTQTAVVLDPIEAASARLLDEVDANAPPNESQEDTTRRRITRLLERAADLEAEHQPDKAVMAIELVLREEPDSALSQKLITRNRDAITSVFQNYLGDPERTPQLARSLNELSNARISPRAAFLLSRIDGMLTLDELLDVSGMPRLEAYRYLCQLYLRGILR